MSFIIAPELTNGVNPGEHNCKPENEANQTQRRQNCDDDGEERWHRSLPLPAGAHSAERAGVGGRAGDRNGDGLGFCERRVGVRIPRQNLVEDSVER